MSLGTLDPILSEQELAAWLNTSRPTLQRQRGDGSGPEFVRLSERRIGYRKSAVERWLASRTASRGGGRDHPDELKAACASSADGGGARDTRLADAMARSKPGRGAPRASRHGRRP